MRGEESFSSPYYFLIPFFSFSTLKSVTHWRNSSYTPTHPLTAASNFRSAIAGLHVAEQIAVQCRRTNLGA
jgi:hypothetical protein